MQQLKLIPATELKIDRSFILDMHKNCLLYTSILVTAAIRNITVRKDAERHLAQMEGRYRCV